MKENVIKSSVAIYKFSSRRRRRRIKGICLSEFMIVMCMMRRGRRKFSTSRNFLFFSLSLSQSSLIKFLSIKISPHSNNSYIMIGSRLKERNFLSNEESYDSPVNYFLSISYRKPPTSKRASEMRRGNKITRLD